MKHDHQPPHNIVISHVYSSDNKGDAALTSVLIADLKRHFPYATLRILKLEAIGEEEFEGVIEQPAFMHYALNKYHSSLLKLAYTVYMLPATTGWAAWFRITGQCLYLPRELREVADAYASADLVVAVGGGYIRSRSGLMNRLNIPLVLHPLLFSYLLNKPTVLYSQSVGPFVNNYESKFVANVLKRMSLIMIREDISVALLASMGVSQNVVRSIDSGFLLDSKFKADIHKTYNIPKDTLVVGVTVRSWLKGSGQIEYERAVAGALDNLVEDFGAHILFIPQVTAAGGDDDRVVSRRVHQYMQQRASATTINNKPDHYHIKAIYDGLDILLGTRFHSVIFSLTSFVPVLAIEYEHKTSGIMQDLGLEQWVIKIEDVTAPKLIDALHRLLQESGPYKDYLRQRLPAYIRKAQHSIKALEKSYYSSLET